MFSVPGTTVLKLQRALVVLRVPGTRVLGTLLYFVED